LPGARGPAASARGGKGSYARTANAAYVPVAVVPSRAVLARLAVGLIVLGGYVALPAAAGAQGGTGGAQPQATPTPAPAPRSAPSLPPVRSKIHLTRLACASACGANGAVRPGALLRVRGTSMRRSAEVHFDGAAGEADDVAAAPVKRRKTSVDVRVPLGAAGGPVTVLDRDGVLSEAAPAPIAVEQPPAAMPAAGGPSIDVDVQAPKAYFDAARPMRVSYVVHDDRPVEVRVELVRVADQAVIASWAPGVVQPEAPQLVQWNGMAGGRVQKPGRYAFRVSSADEAGAPRASSAQSQPDAPVAEPDPAAFTFLRHTFPVLGPHGYGEFAAKFGGGRGHQGQDVFAACGTPMVAARGGVVKFKQYHSRAGYYLVIDGERTGVDYAYMHLRSAALVEKGQRVRTGQLIGYVGDTGDASGCHLHFEMWTAPGWYSGGSPYDPLPDLMAWDKSS
jgi:murein DD-endopeptidase MepM/ murein hydrolase activator NlpD